MQSRVGGIPEVYNTSVRPFEAASFQDRRWHAIEHPEDASGRAGSILVAPRPGRALKLALRLPAHLYRFRLGWLLGHRFLLLTHRGRKSGLLRRTPLEVLLYDPFARESIVLSAWGKKADWYRNIATTPAVEVETGGERYATDQRFLSTQEGHAVVTEYAIRHPLAARVLERAFGFEITRSEAGRRAFSGSVALVAFRPKG